MLYLGGLRGKFTAIQAHEVQVNNLNAHLFKDLEEEQRTLKVRRRKCEIIKIRVYRNTMENKGTI